MNRFLIFNLYLICSQLVSAQVERGNYIIGGSAGLDHITNGRRYNVTSVNISPMYGSFLTDHFLIGGNANMNYLSFYRRGNTSLKGGPLMRYYFSNMLFLQADYNFGIPGRFLIEHDIYARLGYAYFLNDHVAIEPYIYAGYRDLVYKGSANTDYLDYGIYFSIQAYLESAMNKTLKMRGTKTKEY